MSKKSKMLSSPKKSSPKQDCNSIGKWWNGIEIAPDVGTLPSKTQQIYWRSFAEKIGIRLIGSGTYGTTYIACKGTDCNYIIKIQENDEMFHREVNALVDLNGWEYTPIIYDAWTCGTLGFIVMEKLDDVGQCIRNFKKMNEIEQEINRIVDILHEKGWSHGDMHLGNLMCKNGHFAFIDFGQAQNFSEVDSIYIEDLIYMDKMFDVLFLQIKTRYKFIK